MGDENTDLGDFDMATRKAPQSQADFNDYLASELRTLKTAHETLKADVAEIVEILRMAKTFFKVANFLGSLLKYVIGIGVTAIALYNALKSLK